MLDDRQRSLAIIFRARALVAVHRVDSFVERDFGISFLEMSTAVDSFSIPSFADYAYPTCVGAQ